MPKVLLKQRFARKPPVPTDKQKIQYFDELEPGFILEVTKSGNATYYLRCRDKHNRLRQVRIGSADTMSVDEARKQARKLKAEPETTPTFSQFTTTKYLPYVRTRKKSWKKDQDMINKKLPESWGSKRLDQFKTGDILELQTSLLNEGLKPGTVNRIMTMVKHIFNLAKRWEYIEDTPTRKVAKLKDPGVKERFLSEAELDRLLDSLDKTRARTVADIVRFLILTGARRSEVVYLPWSEINLEAGIWTLPPERNKANSRKIIPLSENAMKMLKSRQGNGSRFVFPNPDNGEPYKHFHHTWVRIRERANLPDLRLHDLRHSYASFLINSGRTIYEVQKLLGHSDIKTTQKYAHLTNTTLLQATDIVSKLVK